MKESWNSQSIPISFLSLRKSIPRQCSNASPKICPGEKTAPAKPPAAPPKKSTSNLCFDLKTTIDLPEEILRRAETMATQKNTTLSELIASGLRIVLFQDFKEGQTSDLADAFAIGHNIQPVGRLRRQKIYRRPGRVGKLPRITNPLDKPFTPETG